MPALGRSLPHCFAIVSALALLAWPSHPASSATGRADVRLVRLLSDVPDSIAGADSLHNVRVRLVTGNVLVFRKHGEFAALLPIDEIEGNPDSLRYFYYVEKAPFLWVVPGARTRGIQNVADGAMLHFNTFRLLWKRGGHPRAGDGTSASGGATGSNGATGTTPSLGSALGWIYFPNDAANEGLSFSVVSGQSVDEANPKDTEYWIELGSADRGGF